MWEGGEGAWKREGGEGAWKREGGSEGRGEVSSLLEVLPFLICSSLYLGLNIPNNL